MNAGYGLDLGREVVHERAVLAARQADGLSVKRDLRRTEKAYG